MDIKLRLHQECTLALSEQSSNARRAMAEAQESANLEIKSSAGDKHETGRAMAQLDKERHARRLGMIVETQLKLRQIDVRSRYEEVCEGALVQTDIGHFFIAINLGSFLIDGTKYQTISMESPIGLALEDLEEGDSIRVGKREITVLGVQ